VGRGSGGALGVAKKEVKLLRGDYNDSLYR
jgi:hypothetical protein